MKEVFKKTFGLIFILLPFLAIAQPPIKTPEWYESSFTIETSKIVVTAFLTFVTTYFFFLLDKKKKDKKQISYDLTIKNGLLEVDETIKKNIKISYKNYPSANLNLVSINIQNTGNLLIKNQQIRVSFHNANVLDTYHEPSPEPELKHTDISTQSMTEKIFNIGHFERNQAVNYRFVVEGDKVNVTLHPFNEEGNVSFNSRNVNRQTDDKEKIMKFFIVGFLILFVPKIVSYFIIIGHTLSIISFFVLLVIWYPYFISTVRILTDLIFMKKKELLPKSINIEGNNNTLEIRTTQKSDYK